MQQLSSNLIQVILQHAGCLTQNLHSQHARATTRWATCIHYLSCDLEDAAESLDALKVVQWTVALPTGLIRDDQQLKSAVAGRGAFLLTLSDTRTLLSENTGQVGSPRAAHGQHGLAVISDENCSETAAKRARLEGSGSLAASTLQQDSVHGPQESPRSALDCAVCTTTVLTVPTLQKSTHGDRSAPACDWVAHTVAGTVNSSAAGGSHYLVVSETGVCAGKAFSSVDLHLISG